MTYVGIDPGLTGAIALLNDRSSILIVDMPLQNKTKLQKLISKGRQNIDNKALVDIFRHLILSPVNNPNDIHVVVERQLAMPNQSSVATGKTMMNYGILLGIMDTLKINYSQVDPQHWKKAMIWRRNTLLSVTKKSNLKASSIEQALTMFPTSSGYINKKRHHNRAEALLLAAYCRKNYNTLKAIHGEKNA